MTGRPQKLRDVGEQPAQSLDRIRRATSIEELMPDADRRGVALGGIAGVVEHADEIWPCRVGASKGGRALLNARERGVLQALSYGLSREEAGARLGVRLETVKERLKSAKRKLGARNTENSVALAFRQGLIE